MSKNWSSSEVQSARDQTAPLGSLPAQKCPLKWVPISWPAATAAFRSATRVATSASVPPKLIDARPVPWPGPL
jgi:hypothetical protein